ncbi:hypothetical protein [Aliiroseovarius halocynthiae]|uniref:Uncharacterized protein n=1 Tax=Aliiroseovarius halocynthiae TaxID=985055 RepID=A0A545SKS4_9RHOB|nr:hypothetical protein [Aliiroseovarius halocynthiae]TQV65580.1 hypothetical protein FIL88_16600 [Aliiroseovarius halocynthiae]
MYEDDCDALKILDSCERKAIAEWSVKDFDDHPLIFDVFPAELSIYNWGCLLTAMCREGSKDSISLRYSLMNISSIKSPVPVHIWSRSSFRLTGEEKVCSLLFLDTLDSGSEFAAELSEVRDIIEYCESVFEE